MRREGVATTFTFFTVGVVTVTGAGAGELGGAGACGAGTVATTGFGTAGLGVGGRGVGVGAATVWLGGVSTTTIEGSAGCAPYAACIPHTLASVSDIPSIAGINVFVPPVTLEVDFIY